MEFAHQCSPSIVLGKLVFLSPSWVQTLMGKFHLMMPVLCFYELRFYNKLSARAWAKYTPMQTGCVFVDGFSVNFPGLCRGRSCHRTVVKPRQRQHIHTHRLQCLRTPAYRERRLRTPAYRSRCLCTPGSGPCRNMVIENALSEQRQEKVPSMVSAFDVANASPLNVHSVQ